MSDDKIRVYWQTGCTSCLRTKEFLTRHGVAFLSRNVLEDETAFQELARFGLRQVPIVTRGDAWVNGQVLADVARIAGIPWGTAQILAPAELGRRLDAFLSAAEHYLEQLPDTTLATLLPNRPRSHAELAYHIFNIADAFLEHDVGIPLVYESYYRVPAAGQATKAVILDYGRDVRRRLAAWFQSKGSTVDWRARADVYYGEQSLHQFLERTTWHSGQHTRQFAWVLERLGLQPDPRLGPELFAGLPMPEKVWDDERSAA